MLSQTPESLLYEEQEKQKQQEEQVREAQKDVSTVSAFGKIDNPVLSSVHVGVRRRLYVVKRLRDGKEREEDVNFDKITLRIKKLTYGLDDVYVDPVRIAQRVCSGVYPGVPTRELDELAAETAAHLTAEHSDYGILAARIAVSNLHKETSKSFSKVIKDLRNYVNPHSGKAAPKIAEDVAKWVEENAQALDREVLYALDYNYTYFGFKTLESTYLMKINDKVVERPQQMLMRVACGIHCGNLEATLETYRAMSKGLFTPASPTLFNAGTPRPQMSSCFLVTIQEDSIEGIYKTLTDCAKISKNGGGLGVSVSKIRASGTPIDGTNGKSNGLVPMIRLYNNSSHYVDQGGGKRKGAMAMYVEPWHADIHKFLQLKKNHGAEELRARDLFYALWVPDLFMERVASDEAWPLFCPHQCPGLSTSWGKEFNEKFLAYEKQGKAKEVLRARDLWNEIVQAQIENGMPYMLYKDSCNAKSNQKNLGTIECSNLCTEIIQYTSPDDISVCNLASISLPAFVENKKFNREAFRKTVAIVVRNLNRIIDRNFYPVPEAARTNKRDRPIGIGVQGLADVFILLRLPFESKEAQLLNKIIFEDLYFAALSESHEEAKKFGHYDSYKGSPLSEGKFQFHLWNAKPDSKENDWDGLMASILKNDVGVRNSLLIAPMPTASTSQILGNNECFEPYTSNLYVRGVLKGSFVCVNKHLQKDLIQRKIWSTKIRTQLIINDGSVQNIPEIPEDLKQLYKTVWEMKNKTLVNMAAARAIYIDQSQSFIVWMRKPTIKKVTSLHFSTWKLGLKTGLYYLRTEAATEAIKFTVEKEKQLLRQIEKEIKTETITPTLYPPHPPRSQEAPFKRLPQRLGEEKTSGGQGVMGEDEMSDGLRKALDLKKKMLASLQEDLAAEEKESLKTEEKKVIKKTEDTKIQLQEQSPQEREISTPSPPPPIVREESTPKIEDYGDLYLKSPEQLSDKEKELIEQEKQYIEKQKQKVAAFYCKECTS